MWPEHFNKFETKEVYLSWNTSTVCRRYPLPVPCKATFRRPEWTVWAATSTALRKRCISYFAPCAYAACYQIRTMSCDHFCWYVTDSAWRSRPKVLVPVRWLSFVILYAGFHFIQLSLWCVQCVSWLCHRAWLGPLIFAPALLANRMSVNDLVKQMCAAVLFAFSRVELYGNAHSAGQVLSPM